MVVGAGPWVIVGTIAAVVAAVGAVVSVTAAFIALHRSRSLVSLREPTTRPAPVKRPGVFDVEIRVRFTPSGPNWAMRKPKIKVYPSASRWGRSMDGVVPLREMSPSPCGQGRYEGTFLYQVPLVDRTKIYMDFKVRFAPHGKARWRGLISVPGHEEEE